MTEKRVKTLLAASLSCLILLTVAACSNARTASDGGTEPTKPASYKILQEGSSGDQVSASSASESSAAESNSTEQRKDGAEAMNISALANGDYASVKGTWQDAAGNQLVFDDQGLVSTSYELYGASLTDYGTAAAGVYGGETGGFLLEFIPKGVKLADKEAFQDNSDSSRDRLWTGVGMNSFDEQGQFYYRVD